MYCTRSYKREKNKLAFLKIPNPSCPCIPPPFFFSPNFFFFVYLFYSILFYSVLPFLLYFSPELGACRCLFAPPPFFWGGGVEGEGEGEGRGEREKRGVCLCLPDRGTNWWVNLMWCDKESNRIKSNRIEARCDKYVCRSRPSRPALEGIFFSFFWLLAFGFWYYSLSLSLSTVGFFISEAWMRWGGACLAKGDERRSVCIIIIIKRRGGAWDFLSRYEHFISTTCLEGFVVVYPS